MVSSNTSAGSPSAAARPLQFAVGASFRPQQFHSFTSNFQWTTTSVQLEALLDRTFESLRSLPADVAEAPLIQLFTGLHQAKCSTDDAGWNAAIKQCVGHPLRALIHQDPFARRCFEKPRGYAGDAQLIDFLYSRDCRTGNPDPVTPLGEKIFEYTRDIPAGHAVRCRRDLMAVILDEVCATRPTPHILSVACGHLREAKLSTGITSGKAGRFIALDQDQLSLETVRNEVSRFGVTAVHDSIKALFRGSVAGEKFDLIYSTGLYDYLDDRMATKLTHRMFDMLKPGGRVVVANFVPNLVCSAYMESFLDWKLIYRNCDQLHQVSSTIPDDLIASRKVFLEDNDTIVFLDMVRR